MIKLTEAIENKLEDLNENLYLRRFKRKSIFI